MSSIDRTEWLPSNRGITRLNILSLAHFHNSLFVDLIMVMHINMTKMRIIGMFKNPNLFL